MRQNASSLYQWLMIGLLAAGLTGCATLGWYGQAAHGQLELLLKRKDIEKLLAAPDLAPTRRRRLEHVLAVRAFAADALALPHEGSYGDFVALDRDAVVYNVVAAPEFSVEPRTWCYPIAGCVSYRGYFRRAAAERYAARLDEQGYDTAVLPVAAYSTLGRFDDPVTSPMLARSPTQLAALLFHELAHQRVFVPGDTRFNEAYATTVERAGVRRWLGRRGDDAALQDWESGQRTRRAFTALLLETRAELAALYRSDLDAAAIRAAKRATLARLRDRYAAFRRQTGDPRFDGWMRRELNNAHLAVTAAYEAGTDAFGDLLAECGGDLARFHHAAERLAAAERSVRAAFLNRSRIPSCP